MLNLKYLNPQKYVSNFMQNVSKLCNILIQMNNKNNKKQRQRKMSSAIPNGYEMWGIQEKNK